MKKYRIYLFLAFVMMCITSCKSKVNSSEDANQQDIKISTIDTSTTSDEHVETSYLPVTIEYFENVNKDYTFVDIANEIGPNSGITGSGIIYYVWDIDKNVKAKLLFSRSDGKISRIQISGIEEKDVVLYKREDVETSTDATKF